jgi:transcriptional regulator with XRE-family HTH domain
MARTKRNTDTALDRLVGSIFGRINDSELSKRTTIARKTWRTTCEGTRRPRLHTVERIAAALGVEVSTVLDAIEETMREARERKASP